MAFDPKFIRNFSIIAHIDHGKSTLADQLLLQSGAITQREFREQLLDDMDLERERGITIKARAVAINYVLEGQNYELNLIDTPGHVDFHYEVSRSLAACEGAILLVDATQGVQAQTVANAYAAINANLTIVPALNKIDMQAARPDEIREEIETTLGIDPSEVLAVSGKTGLGVPEIFKAIIDRVPPPPGDVNGPLRALIFDSKFDDYQGVVIYIRVVDGLLKIGQKIRLMAQGTEHEVINIGRFRPRETPCDDLGVGQVGYVTANIKKLSDVRIGDTITDAHRPASEALSGYQEPSQVVYCGLFPATHNQFEDLRTALQKLSLNDASFTFEPESSHALGIGFRCGFLGLLHMEIVRERLEREFDLSLIATAPSVAYRAFLTDGSEIDVDNPTELPDASRIERIDEPMLTATILTPSEYTGTVMELCQSKRAEMTRMEYLSPERVELVYTMPLAEVVLDFFDQLKSRTKGYASLDYEPAGYATNNLVRVDILINHAPCDAFSTIVHRSSADNYGRRMADKLRELIPRQMFDVPIQAAIGGRIVARETVKAKRKDVLSKCYGGDITRKRKLLEKQKEGKKRMKNIGRVEVPQEAFISALRLDD
jgi:GTP-binding protein LepA